MYISKLFLFSTKRSYIDMITLMYLMNYKQMKYLVGKLSNNMGEKNICIFDFPTSSLCVRRTKQPISTLT